MEAGYSDQDRLEQNIDNSLIDRIEDGIIPADIDPEEPTPEAEKEAPGAEPEDIDPTKGTPDTNEEVIK